MLALKDGQLKNGGIILVKKLSIEEIEEMEEKISHLKENSYYKHYFLLNDNSKPLEAYIINNNYYLDITSTNNFKLVGLIKLQADKNNNLSELVSLFITLYKKYKKIGFWYSLENRNIDIISKSAKKRMMREGARVFEKTVDINNKKIKVIVFVESEVRNGKLRI